MSTHIQQAIEIIHRTQDGNDLSPEHLRLTEAVVNFGLSGLTPSGQDAWKALYEEVSTGQYKKPWLAGVENLTQDTEGYVYWRGTRVEHYSHTDMRKMHAAAERLGQICRYAEANNIPVVDWPSLGPIYDKLRFCEGHSIPRKYVFWSVGRERCNFQVATCDHIEVASADLEKAERTEALRSEWGISTWGMRSALIASAEDFDGVLSTMSGDMQWIRSAHQIPLGRQHQLTEWLTATLDRETFWPESASSELFLSTPASASEEGPMP